MTWQASSGLVWHELRVIRADLATLVFVLVMPLLLSALMMGLYDGVAAAEGLPGASGAAYAVPGLAVSFAAFGAGYVGFALFRDHGWGVWDRLRASPASTLDIIVGKVAPPVALTAAQILLLFAVAVPLFDLRVKGSWAALVVIVLALALCLNAFGVAVAALSRTTQQLNAIASVGGLIFATLGGAFVPESVMPAWGQTLTPATPTYWAMTALHGITVQGQGLGDVTGPLLALLGFTTVFTTIALARFRFEEPKAHWG